LAVVLVLVVLPVIAFAVGKSHPSHSVAHPGTAYVTTANAYATTVKSALAQWLREHPNSGCHVQGQTAICDGGTNIVVIVGGTSQAAAP
jgi:hypothetical protein